MSVHPSRRQILRSTLASSGLGLAIGYPALTFAQSAAPTAQCHDADEATIRQTEGPYFKPSSPQRAYLVASISLVCGQLFSSLFFFDFHRTNLRIPPETESKL